LSPRGSTNVHLRLPNDLYDDVDAEAREQRIPLCDLLRQRIRGNSVAKNRETDQSVQP